jgi:hypothetical protein
MLVAYVPSPYRQMQQFGLKRHQQLIVKASKYSEFSGEYRTAGQHWELVSGNRGYAG